MAVFKKHDVTIADVTNTLTLIIFNINAIGGNLLDILTNPSYRRDPIDAMARVKMSLICVLASKYTN